MSLQIRFEREQSKRTPRTEVIFLCLSSLTPAPIRNRPDSLKLRARIARGLGLGFKGSGVLGLSVKGLGLGFRSPKPPTLTPKGQIGEGGDLSHQKSRKQVHPSFA